MRIQPGYNIMVMRMMLVRTNVAVEPNCSYRHLRHLLHSQIHFYHLLHLLHHLSYYNLMLCPHYDARHPCLVDHA